MALLLAADHLVRPGPSHQPFGAPAPSRRFLSLFFPGPRRVVFQDKSCCGRMLPRAKRLRCRTAGGAHARLVSCEKDTVMAAASSAHHQCVAASLRFTRGSHELTATCTLPVSRTDSADFRVSRNPDVTVAVGSLLRRAQPTHWLGKPQRGEVTKPTGQQCGRDTPQGAHARRQQFQGPRVCGEFACWSTWTFFDLSHHVLRKVGRRYSEVDSLGPGTTEHELCTTADNRFSPVPTEVGSKLGFTPSQRNLEHEADCSCQVLAYPCVCRGKNGARRIGEEQGN